METQLATKVAQEFKTPTGENVDVLFATSDGRLFYDPEEANSEAKKLGTNVSAYYRDEPVRKMADKHEDLRKVIYATDTLKQYKALKKNPIPYDRYVQNCKYMGVGPVPQGIFSFIRSKVFRTKKPMIAGERDTILSWKHGVVEAIFLRRYPQGQVWHYMNDLIFTCPTNTELVSGTYEEIFTPFL